MRVEAREVAQPIAVVDALAQLQAIPVLDAHQNHGAALQRARQWRPVVDLVNRELDAEGLQENGLAATGLPLDPTPVRLPLPCLDSAFAVRDAHVKLKGRNLQWSGPVRTEP